MPNNLILIVDFGGQYSQLIARRVRELKVYCEICKNYDALKIAKTKNPCGIIFSGGPNSIYNMNSPKIEKEIFKLNLPILGICYGAQLMAQLLGGEVKPSKLKEYGKVKTKFNLNSILFKDVKPETTTLMSHTDHITNLPKNFTISAKSENNIIAAIENSEKNFFGVQFHPEVNHTEFGKKIIENFLFLVCKAKPTWKMESFLENVILKVREKVKNKKILLALSGGVDSSVLAAVLSKAVGNQLICVFVNHGFMRKGEEEKIKTFFSNWNLNFVEINAQDRFLEKLKNIINPEEKRKIIGKEFIEVFQKKAKELGKIDYFAQGTIYPDVIESGLGQAATIKSHHNVGGLPKVLNFKEIIEPFRILFKDEVRQIGKQLNLPPELVNRQPFPGPGLAIRIIGEITKKKLEILKEADLIFRQEIEKFNFSKPLSQYFAVLTSIKSVGVMGDERTYSYVLALRAVETSDFMTADFAKLPYELLEKISSKIVNEVKEINRIVYDITSKPPATIEFE